MRQDNGGVKWIFEMTVNGGLKWKGNIPLCGRSGLVETLRKRLTLCCLDFHPK